MIIVINSIYIKYFYNTYNFIIEFNLMIIIVFLDLNLMDWSNDNIVTVALGKIVYLWNAGTGNIEELREYENGDHACSLSWIQEGHILAIGTNDGTVELWDCVQKKRLVIYTM